MGTQQTIVLGFTGKKGSGKDTACDWIKGKLEALDFKVFKFAFGDVLKEICVSRYHLDRRYLWGTQDDKETQLTGYPSIIFDSKHIKTPNMTYRQFMTALGDTLGPHVFTQTIAESVANVMSTVDSPVILFSDIRYKSEYDYVRSIGGKVIKVNSEGIGDMSHPSEQQDIPCEWDIDGRGLSPVKKMFNQLSDSMWYLSGINL
jgi:hypothetical protein